MARARLSSETSNTPPPRRQRGEPVRQSLPSISSLVLTAEEGEASRGVGRHRDLQALKPANCIEIDDEDTEVYYLGLPLKVYWIDHTPFTMTQPENETTAIHRRKTADGRMLTYKLTVVQQPARARACGSGPRSAADRRPVDPPPVVELHVFEGDEKTGNDITISHDATFILYASLEVARPIAHGRLYAGPVVPVLTGVPVAGTAYLDKPSKAGYFIFPDLSVRHEGFYNLKFDLFEGVKNAADAHVRPVVRPAQHDTKPVNEDRLTNLTFVRSEKFQVFSAKRFPGLDSSTEMSRCIAEQGCRVRIRREVRQRKRVQSKPDDNDDDELGEEVRSSRATSESVQLPSTPAEHARSMSRNSQHDLRSLEGDHSRRVSTDTAWPSQLLPSMINPTSPRAPSPQSLPHSMVTPLATNHPSPSYTASMLPPSSISGSSYLHPMHAPSNTSFEKEHQAPQQLPSIQAPALPQPPAPSHSLASLMTNRMLPLPVPTPRASNFDTATRQWNIPEPTQQKRTHSPASYSQSTPLKSGARPDATKPAPSPSPATVPGRTSGSYWAAAAMEPDNDDAEDDGHDSDDSSYSSGPYTYKRANGTMGNKVVMHLSKRGSRSPRT